MTLPIHTVKHVKSEYRRYQVIAILFAAITLTAALTAAISGIQLAKLRKVAFMQTEAAIANPPVDPALTAELERLKSELTAEKDKSNKLGAEVATLKKKMAALKKAKPAPVAKPTPAKPKQAPVKPQPESALSKEQAPQPETEGSQQKVDAPLPTPADESPAPVTEPPAVSLPTQPATPAQAKDSEAQSPLPDQQAPSPAPAVPEKKIPSPPTVSPQPEASGGSSPAQKVPPAPEPPLEEETLPSNEKQDADQDQ